MKILKFIKDIKKYTKQDEKDLQEFFDTLETLQRLSLKEDEIVLTQESVDFLIDCNKQKHLH